MLRAICLADWLQLYLRRLKVKGEAVAAGAGAGEGVLAGIEQSQKQKMTKHLMMQLQQKMMDCRRYHYGLQCCC